VCGDGRITEWEDQMAQRAMTNEREAQQHAEWMRLALAEARRALDDGEAPIGCVLVDGTGAVIGQGHNTMRDTGIVTAHAEMNAFAAAGDKVVPGEPIVMVSTLEPCVMCTGAAMQAGVTTIVFGLRAPADSGTGRVHPPDSPNTSAPTIVGEVGADESRALFYSWLEKHAGDASREEQRQFIEQLLALTQDGEMPKPVEGTEAHEHA
jgi:tRNA(adenine34) deaminase